MDMTTALIPVAGAVMVPVLAHRLQVRRERRAREIAGTRERGALYDEFTSGVIGTVGYTQLVAHLAPRARLIAWLPPTEDLRVAIGHATAAGNSVIDTSGRLRSVAPEKVAAAAEELLKVVEEAFALMGQRSQEGWGTVWERLRKTRIEFEALARVDCAIGERRTLRRR